MKIKRHESESEMGKRENHRRKGMRMTEGNQAEPRGKV